VEDIMFETYSKAPLLLLGRRRRMAPQPSPYNGEGGRKKKYADELHAITV
jgi:hypothetical protein